jgi:exodeoxyribonuclease-5
MINEYIAQDILSFGVPILVLGDPAQLPPVKGSGYFTSKKPDFMLMEVHRQEAGSPVLDLAELARKNEPINFGQYGDSKKIRKTELDIDQIIGTDQILVGKNVTRKKINQNVRNKKEFTSKYPQKGDKLISFKNYKDHDILNGSIGIVVSDVTDNGKYLSMQIQFEFTNQVKTVNVHKARFDDYDKPGIYDKTHWREFQMWFDFDYAYAITVHKAQGSQWGDVMICYDGYPYGDDLPRWLYTGITRAVNTVTIVE